MKKNFNFNLYKLSISLFVSVILLLGFSEIIAQPSGGFPFGVGDFRVVDNTRKVGLPGGSFVANGNTYQLTGNVASQSIALWHDDCIDVFWQFRN